MRTLLYSTIFPASIAYFDSFWQSIKDQTDKDFDICFALDDISQETITSKTGNTPIRFIFGQNDTAASLRERALMKLCPDYDAVILVDSDDVLLPTRVSAAKEALETNDVYACALNLINEQGQALNKTFSCPVIASWEGFLSKVNVYGFSNTAYRSELLSQLFPIPRETVMVDWLVATKALALGANLYFDTSPHMLYRQYDNNTARVLSPYKAEQITKASALVLHHYGYALEDDIIKSKASLVTLLKERQQELTQFSKLLEEPEQLERYTGALNELKDVFMWWECIAHPDLEILWT